jgi:hypothetical protein
MRQHVNESNGFALALGCEGEGERVWVFATCALGNR